MESLKIYSGGNNFYLMYEKYKADCDKINDNNLTPAQILIKTINKKLSDKGKIFIRQYIHDLIDAKISEPMYMNFGYLFQVKTIDASLNISVFTWGEITKNKYGNFIRNLLK